MTDLKKVKRLGYRLERVLIADDTPRKVHRHYGNALQASGRPGEAVEQFRRALEIRPGFAQAHRDLAMALRELGCHDEALEHLRTAVEMASPIPRGSRRGCACSCSIEARPTKPWSTGRSGETPARCRDVAIVANPAHTAFWKTLLPRFRLSTAGSTTFRVVPT